MDRCHVQSTSVEESWLASFARNDKRLDEEQRNTNVAWTFQLTQYEVQTFVVAYGEGITKQNLVMVD